MDLSWTCLDLVLDLPLDRSYPPTQLLVNTRQGAGSNEGIKLAHPCKIITLADIRGCIVSTSVFHLPQPKQNRARQKAGLVTFATKKYAASGLASESGHSSAPRFNLRLVPCPLLSSAQLGSERWSTRDANSNSQNGLSREYRMKRRGISRIPMALVHSGTGAIFLPGFGRADYRQGEGDSVASDSKAHGYNGPSSGVTIYPRPGPCLRGYSRQDSLSSSLPCNEEG